MKLKRTNIVLNYNYIDKLKQITHLETAKEVVDFALERFVKTKLALDKVHKLKGKIQMDPNYNYKEYR